MAARDGARPRQPCRARTAAGPTRPRSRRSRRSRCASGGAGRTVDILTTAGRRLGTVGGEGLRIETLLDELAVLAPDPDAPMAAAIRRLRAPARRGMLVVVTGAPDDLTPFTALAGTGSPVTLVIVRRHAAARRRRGDRGRRSARRAGRRLEPRHGVADGGAGAGARHDRDGPVRTRRSRDGLSVSSPARAVGRARAREHRGRARVRARVRRRRLRRPAARRRDRPARDRLGGPGPALAARAHRRARRRRDRPRARLDQRGRGHHLRHPHRRAPSPASATSWTTAGRSSGPASRRSRRCRASSCCARSPSARSRSPPTRSRADPTPRSPRSDPRWCCSCSPAPSAPTSSGCRRPSPTSPRRSSSSRSPTRRASRPAARGSPAAGSRRTRRSSAVPPSWAAPRCSSDSWSRRSYPASTARRCSATATRRAGPPASATTRASARSWTCGPGSSERSNIELFRVESDVALYWRLDRARPLRRHHVEPRQRGQGRVRGVRQPHAGRHRAPAVHDQLARRPVAAGRVQARVHDRRQRPGHPGLVDAHRADVGLEPQLPGPLAGRAAADRPPDRRHRPAAPAPPARRPRAPRLVPRRAPAPGARDHRAGATPWDKAVALQRFFTDGSFTYDLDVRPGDGPSAIDEFLTTRRGFCQQFAAAYAALARAARAPEPGRRRLHARRLRRGRRRVRRARPRRARVGRGVVRRARVAHLRADARRARARARPTRAAPARPTPRDGDGHGAHHRDQRADVGHHRRGGSAGAQRPIRDPGNLVTAGSTASDGGWSAKSVATVALLVAARGRSRVALADPALEPAPPRPAPAAGRAPVPRPGSPARGSDALDACRGAGLPVSGALDPGRAGAVARRERCAVGRGAAARRARATCTRSSSTRPTPRQPDASERAWHAADDVRGALLVGVGTGERVRRALRGPWADGDEPAD